MRIPIGTRVRILDGSKIRTKCNLFWNNRMSTYIGMETYITEQQRVSFLSPRKRVYLNITLSVWLFSEEWLEKIED